MKRFALAILASLVAVTAVVAPVAQAQDRTVGERVDDATITAALKAKLVADSPRNLVKVNVDTKDGVVNLNGTVSSVDEGGHRRQSSAGRRRVRRPAAEEQCG